LIQFIHNKTKTLIFAYSFSKKEQGEKKNHIG